MRLIILLSIAGGLGTAARHLIGMGSARYIGIAFPWGTLLANLAGCLLIGFFGHLAFESRILSRDAGIVIMTGFLGGLTTFATLALEGTRLTDAKQFGLAALYIGVSVLVGLWAVWIGAWLARTSI